MPLLLREFARGRGSSCNNVTYIPLTITERGDRERPAVEFTDAAEFSLSRLIVKKNPTTTTNKQTKTHKEVVKVVNWRNKGAEWRLPPTCDVPQLQSDQSFAVPVDDFEGEVDPDRRPVVLREKLVHVALDDAGFPDAQLPDDQNFEQVLLTLGHRTPRHAETCRWLYSCPSELKQTSTSWLMKASCEELGWFRGLGATSR